MGEVAVLKPPKDDKGTLPAVNEDLVVQEEQVKKTDLQVMHAEGHVGNKFILNLNSC